VQGIAAEEEAGWQEGHAAKSRVPDSASSTEDWRGDGGLDDLTGDPGGAGKEEREGKDGDTKD
jgi:hypothetical protein